MNDLADFTTHRIVGFANATGKPFSVPLFTQIDGNLWMGGCPRGKAPEHFKFIVSLYKWEPYKIADHQILTTATMFDSHDLPDEGVLITLAKHVNEARKVGPTLVHCQAGLNRSGLITALALMESGMSASEATRLLREKRCDQVLCNPIFFAWLLGRGL